MSDYFSCEKISTDATDEYRKLIKEANDYSEKRAIEEEEKRKQELNSRKL